MEIQKISSYKHIVTYIFCYSLGTSSMARREICATSGTHRFKTTAGAPTPCGAIVGAIEAEKIKQ